LANKLSTFKDSLLKEDGQELTQTEPKVITKQKPNLTKIVSKPIAQNLNTDAKLSVNDSKKIIQASSLKNTNSLPTSYTTASQKSKKTKGKGKKKAKIQPVNNKMNSMSQFSDKIVDPRANLPKNIDLDLVSGKRDLNVSSKLSPKPNLDPASAVKPVNIVDKFVKGGLSKKKITIKKDIKTVMPSVSIPTASTGKYPLSIHQLMDFVIERDASDLHLSVGYPATIRVDGSLVPVSEVILTKEMASELVTAVLPDSKKELLEVNREVDLAYAHGNDARFRINAYYQQQTLAAAFRLIPNKIRSLEELKMPPIFNQLAKLRQGFVLVTGPTGSGKSTTLAALVQEINKTRTDHIITVEDPIEYIYPKGKAFIDQRELHDDTHSWEIAMKSALRQDPDVVLVGELRDYETISAAITLAETGHLVFATLHTNSAPQTVDRLIDVFPEHQQSQVRSQLSNALEAVVAQRLIPLDKGGRTAVTEVLIATPAIRNLIREGKTHQLGNVIVTSADIGMTSMESSLVKLVREGAITMERAQEYAVHPEEIVRLLK